jgi:two-component system, OmpR family, alkaline phosphatase synthesis response regulator PhoP
MATQKKVLIIDDEEIVVRGIKKGLEYNGFYVKTILGGRPAIDLAKKEFFDIVLVDLIMPGMNGVDTCKRIKEISPKTEVLLLSGYPKEIERFQTAFIDAGGRDLFLRKPLMANEVKDAIDKILKTKV